MSIHNTMNACGKRVLAVVLLLSTNGCTTSNHSSSPPVHQVSPSTAPSPGNTVTASGNALAAYTGMWNDMAHASDTANWQDPSLPHHAAAEALAEMVSGLYSMSQKGLVTRGAPALHPRVTNSTATAADITDCASTTAWLEYVAATGKLKDSIPGGNRLITAHVELADGVWRVTEYSAGDLGSC